LGSGVRIFANLGDGKEFARGEKNKMRKGVHNLERGSLMYPIFTRDGNEN